ncbi:MAG: protein-disulfide isomerase [Thaumarchaeota archaeon]|nr:protein-disulfide isomerase [Nitrososphaerota archaeon]
MGKKERENKEERRESFVDRQSRQKRKNMLIGIAVLAGIVAIIAFASFHFITKTQSSPLNAPEGAGKLGDEHEHASLLVRIFGDKFDFSPQLYQVKSPYIHFEGEDGNTIHRHASNIKLGYLFDTIKVDLTDECFAFPDKKPEHTFCANEDYTLKFFVNHQKVNSIRDYVINEDDRILISYGNENQTAIDAQLLELDGQLIKK